MKRIKVLAATIPAAMGIAAAVALTVPAVANAWDWTSLPSGYSVRNAYYTGSDGSTCHKITVNGTYIGDTCTDADFQSKLDSYIDSTICTVNLAADPSLCAPPATTTAAATTNAAPTTTALAQTTTQAPTGAAAPATSAPTAPAPAETVTVVTTVSDPTLVARVTELEQRVAVDEARIATLEQNSGVILGEQKNEPPFNTPLS